MEDKEQSLHEEMLFRIIKVAEILAKSSDINLYLAQQQLLQNKQTSKFEGSQHLSSKKTR